MSSRILNILRSVALVIFLSTAVYVIVLLTASDTSHLSPLSLTGIDDIVAVACVISGVFLWATDRQVEQRQLVHDKNLRLELQKLITWVGILAFGVAGPVLNMRAGATLGEAAFIAVLRLFIFVPITRFEALANQFKRFNKIDVSLINFGA